MDTDFIKDNVEEFNEKITEIGTHNPEHEVAFERNFSITLAEMGDNPEAARYREKFSKLFQNYNNTCNDCKELQKKYDELFKDNQRKDNEIELSIKSSKIDRETLNEMKNYVQYIWRFADEAQEREQIAQTTIDSLQRQIQNLNHKVDLKNKSTQISDDDIEGITDMKQEQLLLEKERAEREATELNKKLQNALIHQIELEQRNTKADSKIAEMCEQIENQNVELDHHKNLKGNLIEEIAKLNQTISDKDTQIENFNTTIRMNLEKIDELGTEIKDEHNKKEKVVDDYEKLMKKFTKLQKNHITTSAELEKLQGSFNKQTTDLKEEIYDLKKSLNETTVELKQQQSLYDNVLSETEQLKQQLKNNNHQIKQLEEDIKAKEQEVMKEENILKQALKEKDNLKNKLNAANNTIGTLKVEKSQLETEQKRLYETINDCNRLNEQHMKSIKQLIEEREVFSAQFVYKNDEIVVLNEKHTKTVVQLTDERDALNIQLLCKNNETVLLNEQIQILQLTLQENEEQYEQRLNDIKLLKIEIEQLRHEKDQLSQKRLQRQSTETPPTLQDELNKTKLTLREQDKRIKCLSAELSMAEWQSKQHQSNLQRITEELHDLKKKYIALKKQQKMQKLPTKELSRDINRNSNSGNKTRFLGGGFRMSSGNS